MNGHRLALRPRPWVLAMVGLAALVLTAGCEQRILGPEEAAQVCERRARDAQGPTGSVSIGVNSNSGVSTDLAIGVTGDYLSGRDPVDIYRECVVDRSGQEPYRAPVLR